MSIDSMIRTEAVALAIGVSVRTLTRLRAEEGFPSPVKVGKACRWNQAEVERWMRSKGIPIDEADFRSPSESRAY